MILESDRAPFFYFVLDGAIVATCGMPVWSGEGSAEAQKKYAYCDMWAYRYNNWIRYNPYKGVFAIRGIIIPECLKLVELLEN